WAGRLAGGRGHPLLNLLDQTGQGVARLSDEDESNQVVLASDRAALLAGAGHELREEPAAVVACPGRRAGFQRVFSLHGAAKQDGGEGGADDETRGHGKVSFWVYGRVNVATSTFISVGRVPGATVILPMI